MFPRIAALSVLVLAPLGAAVAAGCGGLGVSSASAFGAGEDSNAGGTTTEDAGVAAPPSAFDTPDAGAGAGPSGLIGNPLCATKSSLTCNPQRDNLGTTGTTTEDCLLLLPKVDADAAPDGQADAGVAPGPGYACHVALSPSGGVAPVCMPEGTATGTCTASAQCMAGHECVGDGTNLDAQCRHYCCEPDACDVTTFCDVQPIVGTTGTMVPVCMPLANCELLSVNPTQCLGGQCGIALDGKALEITTCLDIGPRGVGEDCETDHCAKDLSCLGAPGARKCFQLCDNSGGSKHLCPMGQTCQSSGTTFKGGSVGICVN
jgi:hypothetical protein